MKIDDDLSKYIYTKIVPMYKKHDKAHDEKHAKEVINASFIIERLIRESLDLNILLASAALHDIGLSVNRKDHNIQSGKIIRNLKTLRKWFNLDEIEIIAQAAEDHRASLGKEPRSIFGKIIADSDRVSLFSIERLMERTWLYRVDSMKENTDEEIFEEMYKHMYNKFSSKHGYTTIWLKETTRAFNKEIKRTQKIVDNKELSKKLFYQMRKDGRLKRS